MSEKRQLILFFLFHDSTELASSAFHEPNLEQSIFLWRKLFGDDFSVSERDIEPSGGFLEASPSLGTTAHARPITDIARGELLNYRAKIDAWVYDGSGRIRFRGINSDVRLSNNRSIKFKTWTDAPEPYEVRWQVVNTGPHASSENGLRGGFFAGRDLKQRPTQKLENWEFTQYTGRHWIESFIIKDGVCIGRSGRFYVSIKNPAY